MFARHIRKKHGFRKMSKTWKCNECGLVLERLELLETHLGLPTYIFFDSKATLQLTLSLCPF